MVDAIFENNVVLKVQCMQHVSVIMKRIIATMKNDSTFIRKPSDSPKQPRSAVQRVVYTDSNWHSECSTGNASQDDGGTNARYASATAAKKSSLLSDVRQLCNEVPPVSDTFNAGLTEWDDGTWWGDIEDYNIRWYVLRCTYGRERLAAEVLMDEGVETFCPTITMRQCRNGKPVVTENSLLPNLFFAYASKVELKTLMREVRTLRMLRFYCRRERLGRGWHYKPLWVPDGQLESFRIICAVREADTLFTANEIPKFSQGQLVRVKDGKFKGVVGRVARFRGQQRVAVNIEGIVTSITAYVPTAFLEPLQS